jgi:flagellar basal-body rod modification protein FlgD
MANLGMNSVLSAGEQAEYAKSARDFNKTLNSGKISGQGLGRDDFLKLLVTQLSYQDPTAPMEDKEFIAQMAQFSSLEQMTNMAGDFAKLTSMIQSSEANSSLGKNVEIVEGERVIQGMVQSVSRGLEPEIMVNGVSYPWESVTKVFAA